MMQAGSSPNGASLLIALAVDVPRDGAMGLAWWLKDRTVTALGPEHAGVGQPAYDRVTRREWDNPYARPVRPVSLSPILEHQQKIMQRVLGHDRLCPGRALGVPDPEFNDDLTW
jgi:hypothetical protein